MIVCVRSDMLLLPRDCEFCKYRDDNNTCYFRKKDCDFKKRPAWCPLLCVNGENKVLSTEELIEQPEGFYFWVEERDKENDEDDWLARTSYDGSPALVDERGLYYYLSSQWWDRGFGNVKIVRAWIRQPSDKLSAKTPWE